MIRYYLLACTLPGNIEKEVLSIKRTLFSKSGLSSALLLPSLVPIQWSQKIQKAGDIAFYPKPFEDGDSKEKKEGPRFTTLFPRMEDGLWWLPVLPQPKVMHRGEFISPFPGIPLVAPPSESSTSALSPTPSSTLSSSTLPPEEEAALKETFHTIPLLTWKAMGLSCFVFSFPLVHSSGETVGAEVFPHNAGSLHRDGPWNNSVFWERGVEWEEVWRSKKPILPGE